MQVIPTPSSCIASEGNGDIFFDGFLYSRQEFFLRYLREEAVEIHLLVVLRLNVNDFNVKSYITLYLISVNELYLIQPWDKIQDTNQRKI